MSQDLMYCACLYFDALWDPTAQFSDDRFVLVVVVTDVFQQRKAHVHWEISSDEKLHLIVWHLPHILTYLGHPLFL